MSPSFAGLQPLIHSLGAVPLMRDNLYYEYTDLPENVKYMEIDHNSLKFINFFLVLLLLPPIAGLVIKCVARSKP